jgi:hypothetical protein
MGDLSLIARNALDPLLRYGAPWSSDVIDVLEKLTDINDDLQNRRDKAVVRQSISEAKRRPGLTAVLGAVRPGKD